MFNSECNGLSARVTTENSFFFDFELKLEVSKSLDLVLTSRFWYKSLTIRGENSENSEISKSFFDFSFFSFEVNVAVHNFFTENSFVLFLPILLIILMKKEIL